MSSPGRAGLLGTLEVRLARWVQPPDQAYQRRYVPVEPSSRTIPGGDDKIAPDTTIAEWHITDWSRGEGKAVWDDTGFYRRSDGGMQPTKDGALAMGHYVLADARVGTVTGNRRVWRTGGAVYTASQADVWRYDGGLVGSWTSTGLNPSGTPVSLVVENVITDTPPLTVYWYTNTDREIRKANTAPGADVLHNSIATALLAGPVPPILRQYRNNIYFLWGNDLYLLDKVTADTETLVADLGFHGGTYWSRAQQGLTDASDSVAHNRAITSDVGIFWAAPSDDGSTYLAEYNESADTFDLIGTIPADSPIVDSVYHGLGFFWTSYRVGDTPFTVGDTAYVYAQDRSGVTRSVIGPLEYRSVAFQANPAVIAGIIGDQLCVVYGGYLHTYDVTTGALVKVAFATAAEASPPSSAVTWGNVAFSNTPSSNINLFSFKSFANDVAAGGTTRYAYTGSFDFGYHGVDKLLLDVTVELKQANISTLGQVIVGYRPHNAGFAFTNLSAMDETDGAIKSWVVSDETTAVIGKAFEFRVAITNAVGTGSAPSGTSDSPEIIRLSARAASAADRIEWVLQLDAGQEQTGMPPWQFLDELHALKDAHAPVLFTDPWHNRDVDGPDTFTVTVEEMFTPPEQGDGDMAVTLRLRATETI